MLSFLYRRSGVLIFLSVFILLLSGYMQIKSPYNGYIAAGCIFSTAILGILFMLKEFVESDQRSAFSSLVSGSVSLIVALITWVLFLSFFRDLVFKNSASLSGDDVALFVLQQIVAGLAFDYMEVFRVSFTSADYQNNNLAMSIVFAMRLTGSVILAAIITNFVRKIARFLGLLRKEQANA